MDHTGLVIVFVNRRLILPVAGRWMLMRLSVVLVRVCMRLGLGRCRRGTSSAAFLGSVSRVTMTLVARVVGMRVRVACICLGPDSWGEDLAQPRVLGDNDAQTE
jgi:hypothetical protein